MNLGAIDTIRSKGKENSVIKRCYGSYPSKVTICFPVLVSELILRPETHWMKFRVQVPMRQFPKIWYQISLVIVFSLVSQKSPWPLTYTNMHQVKEPLTGLWRC